MTDLFAEDAWKSRFQMARRPSSAHTALARSVSQSNRKHGFPASCSIRKLQLGEAYMEGGLVLKTGDLYDLLDIFRNKIFA